ncbi:MAG: MFS transporter [Chloroflexi bacterium]|nr:MFS transporter [Chloroflexota bacterium]
MAQGTPSVPRQSNKVAKSALKFVVLVGVVSLFADMTYEGARSATGPFLSVLGASATVVGIAAGFGELLGYALRFLTGYLADKTRRYWAITILGYCINLLAVPLLALAGNWQVAVALMMAERIGKAVRTPARDAMLSYATRQVGHGWGFGLHEALDQIGAVTGPLIVAAAVYLGEGYRTGFAFLLIPALLALATLAAARLIYPRPSDFDPATPSLEGKGLPRAFWLYLGAIALVAAAYADFPLIAFHFKKAAIVSDSMIPLFFSVAMGVDALAALLFGRLFDRRGFPVLMFAVAASALFAPLVFWGGAGLALLGTVLWGVGMGAQESIMRAAVAQMVPAQKRASAYGVFNAGFGVAWFAGSAVMGVLYDLWLPGLVAFSVGLQLLCILTLLLVRQKAPSIAQ